ncbi:hypothetical protein ESY86_17050 [Subsaximicrobium wynnwilliamsii]|uniref:Uncharacterized protein n=1 Tax=Subsaximicrobium wynnwilliamsii TaxID=291179 RepID=A0A5C6ZE43_9FLAO|nr:hypothetical protein [Subsaximicrobium wynnwilliamsii]TXD83280.1 hypothetical protein ESY87_09920 [Subsaximicrobium wynnwilliamsii]TXD87379.1 hypothetical protein ESY86_17050 [Subsaximicrobium wynnwilliamsii]TXE03303.1 hypothetical protein ESY88_08215 [Subsaximicrobium wynnwilliamsii]
MTNLKAILVCVLLLFSLAKVQAQIIQVTEIDRGSSRSISLAEAQIIDINASLEINLSKTELLKMIAEQYPQYTQQTALESKINAISDALLNQEAILNSLILGVENVESQQQFFDLMELFLMTIGENEMLSQRYEILSEAYFNLENHETLNMEAYIFSRFNADALELKEQLKLMEATKYNVSLVAFKKDKLGGDRVHVQNFDTYTERDYVTIERWVTSLSDSQEEQIAGLAEKAKTNEAKTLRIFESLKTKLITYLPNLDCVQAQKENLMTLLNNPETYGDLTADITLQANELFSRLNALSSMVTAFKSDIGSWTITTPFELKTNLENFSKNSKHLTEDFELLESLSKAIERLRPKFDQLFQGFEPCVLEFEAYFKVVQETLTLLKLQQSNYIVNKTIGDEVHRFSIDNLPSKGFINLKGTGSRTNGDELVLEVVLRVPSTLEGAPEQQFLLEQRSFYMQLIGARSEVAVGMILANPIGSTNPAIDPARSFFYAPSASILLKFGSKSSYFYNEFVDLGVGLNFAASDFDTDGTPEFGTGLVVTGFKDIISFGINYNVTLDEPYWFFGINLPFNLPGLPINSVKN